MNEFLRLLLPLKATLARLGRYVFGPERMAKMALAAS